MVGGGGLCKIDGGGDRGCYVPVHEKMAQLSDISEAET